MGVDFYQYENCKECVCSEYIHNCVDCRSDVCINCLCIDKYIIPNAKHDEDSDHCPCEQCIEDVGYYNECYLSKEYNPNYWCHNCDKIQAETDEKNSKIDEFKVLIDELVNLSSKRHAHNAEVLKLQLKQLISKCVLGIFML